MKKLTFVSALFILVFSLLHSKPAFACEAAICNIGGSGASQWITCCYLLPDTRSGCFYGGCETFQCQDGICLDYQG